MNILEQTQYKYKFNRIFSAVSCKIEAQHLSFVAARA